MLSVIKRNKLSSGPLLDYGARSILAYVQRQCERQHVAVDSLWQSIETAVQACPWHEDYQTTAFTVANFCILAGCRKAAQDPTENVQLLRKHLASYQSGLREAQLRREIENLRLESEVQQEIYHQSHLQTLAGKSAICNREDKERYR